MEILEIIGLFVIALIIGAVFYYGFGRRGPWGTFWVFLFILFIAGLAGRYWISPAGPVIWGYAWLPLIFWIFLIALLIGIASPPAEKTMVETSRNRERVISKADEQREPDRKVKMEEGAAESSAAHAAFGLFFWLLIIIFFVAIVAGFLRV